jgi:hypothetical protein
MISTDKTFSDMAQELAKQKENLILESLGDLVTKGLLVIEETQPVIIGHWSYDQDKYIVKLQQKVNFALKDKEYIQKLEQENKELREKLNNLKTLFI